MDLDSRQKKLYAVFNLYQDVYSPRSKEKVSIIALYHSINLAIESLHLV